jgi:prepilin-type N-terminal cleavage/methylation domain-containing protein
VKNKVKNLLKRDEGFTLIEIVLVLAIAGLILLMVFLAVSGAQRSRRDTQRKEDVSRIASQLEAYASNNNGTYPNSAATLTTFVNTYLTPATSYEDPLSGAQYGAHMTYATFTAGTLAAGVSDYHAGEICGANGFMAAGSANNYAISMGLEQGVTCRSNN